MNYNFYPNNSNNVNIIEDIQYYINEIINSYNISNYIFNYYEICIYDNV